MDDANDKLAIAAGKFRLALALHDDGMALMRQNFRRRHPNESESEIDARVRAWLSDRPPDAPGRVVSWPRRPS